MLYEIFALLVIPLAIYVVLSIFNLRGISLIIATIYTLFVQEFSQYRQVQFLGLPLIDYFIYIPLGLILSRTVSRLNWYIMEERDYYPLLVCFIALVVNFVINTGLAFIAIRVVRLCFSETLSTPLSLGIIFVSIGPTSTSLTSYVSRLTGRPELVGLTTTVGIFVGLLTYSFSFNILSVTDFSLPYSTSSNLLASFIQRLYILSVSFLVGLVVRYVNYIIDNDDILFTILRVENQIIDVTLYALAFLCTGSLRSDLVAFCANLSNSQIVVASLAIFIYFLFRYLVVMYSIFFISMRFTGGAESLTYALSSCMKSDSVGLSIFLSNSRVLVPDTNPEFIPIVRVFFVVAQTFQFIMYAAVSMYPGRRYSMNIEDIENREEAEEQAQ